MQDAYLAICKAEVEHKLGWGSSDDWSTEDFEELSVRIQDESGQVISSTTLKRIWGRVAYDSKPSRHSLDALASFLGHDSWRAFSTAHEIDEPAADAGSPPLRTGTRQSKMQPSVMALMVFVLLLGGSTVLWLGLSNSSEGALESRPVVRFESQPVAFDLPNTVVFEYDVSGVEADSFFIQQSWDMRLRQRVSPGNSVHTSTYFYPGYYSAKLIANDKILLEQPVHIKTQQWKVLLEENPVPVYLPEAALVDKGALAVSKQWLEDAGFVIDNGKHVVGYYLVQDFGPLTMADVSLEAVVSHTKGELLRPCQGGQVTLRGEDGIIQFPFDIPGCTGLMRVTAGEVMLDGESNDLSVLGADYSNWQLVKLDVANKKGRIQIGTNPPYTFEYTHDMGKVVGLWFQFVGRGMIDDVRLKDGSGRSLYEETF